MPTYEFEVRVVVQESPTNGEINSVTLYGDRGSEILYTRRPNGEALVREPGWRRFLRRMVQAHYGRTPQSGEDAVTPPGWAARMLASQGRRLPRTRGATLSVQEVMTETRPRRTVRDTRRADEGRVSWYDFEYLLQSGQPVSAALPPQAAQASTPSGGPIRFHRYSRLPATPTNE